MDSLGIDHAVHCVRDLDRARAAYGRLGFTTTPRAEHPFGTGNSLIQLDGNFIELLGVVSPANIQPRAPGHFSFGAYNQDFLVRREGMSMLSLASADAAADHARFAAAGFPDYAPFDFARQATLPDGKQVRVAFSLAFVTDPAMPEAAFFVCQQHAPEYFWKPEYQRHANGALVIEEIIMTAAAPAVLAGFFTRLFGTRAVHEDGGGLRVETPRGRISVLAPDAFAARLPGAATADAPATPRFAGYRVGVADATRARALLDANGVSFGGDGESLWIGPGDAFGAVVELAPRGRVS